MRPKLLLTRPMAAISAAYVILNFKLRVYISPSGAVMLNRFSRWILAAWSRFMLNQKERQADAFLSFLTASGICRTLLSGLPSPNRLQF
jgi:hypothetical protein